MIPSENGVRVSIISILVIHFRAGKSTFGIEEDSNRSPVCYGIRLEFLDIEMTKEEQIAFIAVRDSVIDRLQSQLERILTHLESSGGLKDIPVNEIREFKRVLDSVAGYDPFSSLFTGSVFGRGGHVKDLQVPLRELQEFEQILRRIVRVEGTLSALMYSGFITQPAVQDLRVPLDELKEYEEYS